MKRIAIRLGDLLWHRGRLAVRRRVSRLYLWGTAVLARRNVLLRWLRRDGRSPHTSPGIRHHLSLGYGLLILRIPLGRGGRGVLAIGIRRGLRVLLVGSRAVIGHLVLIPVVRVVLRIVALSLDIFRVARDV